MSVGHQVPTIDDGEMRVFLHHELLPRQLFYLRLGVGILVVAVVEALILVHALVDVVLPDVLDGALVAVGECDARR